MLKLSSASGSPDAGRQLSQSFHNTGAVSELKAAADNCRLDRWAAGIAPSLVATKGISAKPGPQTRSVAALTTALPLRSTTTRKLPVQEDPFPQNVRVLHEPHAHIMLA